jgi:hypothetical protein
MPGDFEAIARPYLGLCPKRSTDETALAAHKNGDGVFNDAPNVVPDADGNGICDERDLRAFGVASNIARTNFFISP